MKTQIIRSEDRGQADHGWLRARHSFSFAGYYDPARTRFGVLRVLNDDIIAGGKGFGTHPHDNMEIITIPLKGELIHQDSMGNKGVIRAGEVQVMSAGSGVQHSEYNYQKEENLNLLQIWLFPAVKNVEPRYQQISIQELEEPNRFYQILSPEPEDQGVWIYQQAWFHMLQLEEGKSASYSLKKEGNGLYLFLIEGNLELSGEELSTRDAMGITETTEIEVTAKAPSRALLMEVPMR